MLEIKQTSMINYLLAVRFLAPVETLYPPTRMKLTAYALGFGAPWSKLKTVPVEVIG